MQQNSDDVEPGGLMEWLVGAAFLGIALYSISSARRHRRTDPEDDVYDDGDDSAVVSEWASERDDECRDGSDDGRGDDEGGSCDAGDSDAEHSPD